MSYNVEERDGPQGGEYFLIKLSGRRQVSVSRKPGDARVWLGNVDDPASYAGQRGGAGTIDQILDDLRARLADATSEELELYGALSELRRWREAYLTGRA